MWAVDAFEAGFDSQALRKLTGFSVGPLPSSGDVTPLFGSALAELQVSQPGTEAGPPLQARGVTVRPGRCSPTSGAGAGS